MTDFDKMTDLEFEMLLENELPEMPPEEIMKEINPISKSMKRIAIGLIISLITIDFFGLKQIMQTIGHILLLLGFRTLSNENKWMKSAYIMTILIASQFFVSVILSVTWIASQTDSRGILMFTGWISAYLLPVRALCLWKGIRMIQEKAGLAPSANSALMLAIWYVIILALAAENYTGGFEVLLLMLCYILTAVCVYRLSKTLDEAGYSVEAALVKMEDNNMKKLIIVVVAVGMVIGMLFFQKVPMNWEIMERQTTAEVEAVKEKLIGLGYPEYALNDLTNEDILACKDAIEVTADIEDIPLNEGRKVTEDRLNKPYSYIKYDVYEYTATDVAVKMGDGKSTWKIFHHFKWNEDMLFCGTEGVEIWPAWRMEDNTYITEETNGHIFYSKNGTDYESKISSVQRITHSGFFGEEEDVFAEFSFPYSGENQRGYLTYSVVQNNEYDLIHSTINYLHQRNPFNLDGGPTQVFLKDDHISNSDYEHIQTEVSRSEADRREENRPPEKLPPHPDEGISH
ncbi:MAG: hypothetical protein IJO16_02345 [Clostridia bacterium]|nr:hypothetical protein [Clostridia bacterium]